MAGLSALIALMLIVPSRRPARFHSIHPVAVDTR